MTAAGTDKLRWRASSVAPAASTARCTIEIAAIFPLSASGSFQMSTRLRLKKIEKVPH
jgi:hypothetical protein